MKAQTKPNPAMYVACYALWLALSFAAIVLMFLVRTTALNFAYMLNWNQFAIVIVNWVVLVVMGIITLIIVLTMEDSFRKGVRKGTFWPRAGKTALFIGLALVIAFVINTAIVTFRVGNA
jgi:hypothetical protein